jgi:hypothetical protein
MKKQPIYDIIDIIDDAEEKMIALQQKINDIILRSLYKFGVN